MIAVLAATIVGTESAREATASATESATDGRWRERSEMSVERVTKAIVREERAIVDEVRRDGEIGEQAFRDGQTLGERLDIFLEKEPPVAVFLAVMAIINGCFGLVYALFVRETSAGPGGEFGKVIAASRKEVVKGIFKFFNGALGTYTTRDRE